MKSIWINRTYRDELREPKQGALWPFYGRENHTSEQIYSRKTWRTRNASASCEAENPRSIYDNCILVSPCPTATAIVTRTLGLAMDNAFGWEAIAG